MTAAALRADDLRVDLGGQPVLRAFSTRLTPGWTAIIGPNRAGKSTLLRTLAGLLRPQAGTVWLGDRPLASVAPAERARQIAWLAQQGEASGDLTVRETVALGRIAHLGLLDTPGPTDQGRGGSRSGADRMHRLGDTPPARPERW